MGDYVETQGSDKMTITSKLSTDAYREGYDRAFNRSTPEGMQYGHGEPARPPIEMPDHVREQLAAARFEQVKLEGRLVAEQARVSKLQAEIERLREYIAYDANCPCCNQNEECEEGCTFKDDCPDGAEKMEMARKILRGE